MSGCADPALVDEVAKHIKSATANFVFDKPDDTSMEVLVSALRRFIKEVLGCDSFTISIHGKRVDVKIWTE